jgi:hypothetical protein
MTPDKNFKMKPSTKAMLALGKFSDSHARGQWKRAMIDAQLCEDAAKRASLKSKDTGGGRGRGAVAPDSE